MDGFWEPFRFEFFRNGLLVATVAGALCGLVGTFVVLRRMSYIGHGLSHAVFGGAAVAAVVGVDFFLGAGLWGVASALLIGRVARRRIVGSDAAIGVVTTASFALGLALFGLYGEARRSTEVLLFGSVLGVDETDIAVVVGVTVATAVAVTLGYRALLFSTFDPEVAAVSGLRVDRLDALLMVVLAVVILATTQVLGAVLVAATLVIPADGGPHAHRPVRPHAVAVDRDRGRRAGSPGWWPATTSTSRRGRPSCSWGRRCSPSCSRPRAVGGPARPCDRPGST